MIIETASYAFVAIDGDGIVEDWNHQAEQTFGWPRTEAIGVELAELIVPDEPAAAHREGLRRYAATGEGRILSRRMELEAIHRDGHQFPIELTIWAAQGGGTIRFNALIDDITDAQGARGTSSATRPARLADRARQPGVFADRLSSTPSIGPRARASVAGRPLPRPRRLQDDQRQPRSRRRRRTARRRRARLGGSLRPADTAARLGGDEFAVLLERRGDRGAAGRARSASSTPSTGPSHRRARRSRCTPASASRSRRRHRPRRSCSATPTSAMYAAKQRGKGALRAVRPAMHAQAVAGWRSKADARAGDRRRAARASQYQPIVELRDGPSSASRRCVRWTHPDARQSSPASSSRSPRRPGSSCRSAAACSREACRQAARMDRSWPARPLYLAVNVSANAARIAAGSSSTTSRAALARRGLEPAALVLEITESILIDDSRPRPRELRQPRRARACGSRSTTSAPATRRSATCARFPFDVAEDRPHLRVPHHPGAGGRRGAVDPGDGSHDGPRGRGGGHRDAGTAAGIARAGCVLGQGFHFSRAVPTGGAGSILAIGRLPLPRRRLQAVPAQGA